MQATKNMNNQELFFSDVTLWEEDGVISFSFEENTIIDAELVYQLCDEFSSFEKSQTKKSVLLNLDGVTGVTLEGLCLLNQKLDGVSNRKAVLVNNENTDIIGRVFVNSIKHNQPTKVFKSALEANAWMN
ncbi:MAG: hypothetical protein CMD35_02620 [Flavobacteriales bacterium]|nr:hypothetical protein [Flavobacteriales bacterium]|tara:strand:- start:205 stop:594 length:390 start_codon:yes stop_codon:yes gene_type:complete